MSNTVIEFNNVGKQYILGTIGTGTLSQDLNRWWATIRGKEAKAMLSALLAKTAQVNLPFSKFSHV